MTDLANEAKKYSYKLLGYRGRSEKELRERLGKKGFPENIISSVLEDLKQSGFLDDKALALNLKRQAVNNRMLGYKGAKLFMLKRGLSSGVIDSAIHYDEDIEFQNIKKLVEKKTKTMENYYTASEKKRLWDYLARRGYSFDTIKKALKNIKLNKEDKE